MSEKSYTNYNNLKFHSFQDNLLFMTVKAKLAL